MDRGTKLMFGAMTVAICLMALNMIGNQSPQAHASLSGGHGLRGETEPTIVWYGAVQDYDDRFSGQQHYSAWTLVRAWSDGLVEARSYRGVGVSCGSTTCGGSWRVISDPNEGLAALSDLDGNGVVGSDDLLRILADWGPAPPNVIPPSDCPLAMITP